MSTAAKFPTLDEVKMGSMQQLEDWWNFLPMPQNDEEREILHQVIERKLDLDDQLEALETRA